jgi:hypothetical protein
MSLSINQPKQMFGIARILGALALIAATFSSLFTSSALAAESAGLIRADFGGQTVASDVHHIADWAVHSRDHKGLPFIIVDKVNAKAAAFDRTGRLIEVTPILLGMGVGDIFPSEVLNMNMLQTRPSQRVTPAGRYFAEEDLDIKGDNVLWVDYDKAIAIHKIPPKKTKQRRHERMASPNPAQHRITYGCINVPPGFYDRVVHAQFSSKGGIVYVLPDSTPLKAVFKSYDVGERRSAHAEQTAMGGAKSAQVQGF